MLASKKRILILGSTGMLGSMVLSIFKNESNFLVRGSARSGETEFLFDASNFIRHPEKYSEISEYDYIINCVGIIKPHCRDDDPIGTRNAIEINALFPHILSDFVSSSKTKIIQIATDCVYDGKTGNYDENHFHNPIDVYGKTKSLGEVCQVNFLNIRTSIVGPEKTSKTSLLEWFLSHVDGETVDGYANHYWNGVTTLQFAHLCKQIIDDGSFTSLREINHTIHYLPNSKVSKYELLNLFNEAFNRNIKVIKSSANIDSVDRTLSSAYAIEQFREKGSMRLAILDLAKHLES